ncbi:MAG: hypothetical protein ACRDT2_00135 [Natronosporangium sp.]
MDRLTPVDGTARVPAARPRALRVDPDFLGPDDEVHPDDDEQVYEDPRPHQPDG